MPRLPPELCDKVIEHLVDDITALTRCAAVCKGWIPASRYTLFGWQTPADEPIERAAVRPDHVFLSLLGSPHCTLRDTVRFLRLDEHDRSPMSTMNGLLHRLAGFRSVQCLDVWGHDFSDVSTDVLSAFTTSTADTMRDLRLRYVHFSTPDQMLQFILTFPFLETLRIGVMLSSETERANLQQLPPTTTQHVYPETHLRTLRIDCTDAYTTSVLAWLISSPTPRLRRVKLDTCQAYPAATPLVCTFIKSLATSLEHLEFSYLSADPYEGITHHVDLSHNTNLRILDMGNIFLDGQQTPFPALLSKVVWPCIEEIRFGLFPIGLFMPDHQPLVWHDASATAEALARPIFNRLRAVVVRIPSLKKAELVQRIKSYLPECEARGILRICGIGDP